MSKLYFLVLLSFISFSCANNEENIELKTENQSLRTQLTELKQKNKQLAEKNTRLKSLGAKSNNKQIVELKDSKLIETLDKRVLEDTLDLAKHGNEYIFKREVLLTQLDNRLFAETFGNISENIELLGYSVFSICDGDSLPLEMCNCTHSIYIVIEPEDLGEAYKLYRIGYFYNVDLISLERIGSEDYAIELIFEHGKYPRKTEHMNLTKMELQKQPGQ